ncbi:MAG: ATP-binding protein, partial [Acidaminobacteraceae bacterium]
DIKRVSKQINLRVTIIETDGSVSHASDFKDDASKLENHGRRAEVLAAFSGEIGSSKRYSNTLEKDLYYVAMPSIKNGVVDKVVRLSVPLETINSYNINLIKQILISIVAGLVVAQLLGSRFISSIVKPIIELNKATKKIAFGNLKEKVNINSNDELGELAENFNIMSSQLEKKIREMNNNAEEMDSILSSMLNGVIALDNAKNIMFINPSAEELFQITEARVTGKNILSVLRNNELDEKIEGLLNGNGTSKIEIEIYEPKHRTLNLYTNTIISENEKLGVLIIIEDITEIRKLENMRKDFVANVSHELKTPLTSIRGFVETLQNGAAENREVRTKFLDIIDLETTRLTSLIEDLLVLSEIENKRSENKSNISISDSLKSVWEMLGNLASMKQIEFETEIEDYLPDIYGSESWLKQMLINLVDNAIKYTDEGGLVKLSIYREEDSIIISVKDNGVGISNEHIERLFERFYRVDKARSRNVGGTGLGLAIVKHVMLSFNGHINVKSVLGEGSEFIVSIPISRVFK